MKKAKPSSTRRDSPKAYPEDQLGPLRRPGARRPGARHRRLLRRHRPRPGVGAWKPPQVPARSTSATWKPKPREFFKFVKAVGKRYSGKYRDENEDGIQAAARLLLVDLERAQPGRLADPAVDQRQAPSRPILYRDLWYYGRSALDATGHGDDIVLIGETAPLGNTKPTRRRPMYPKRFIRSSSASTRRHPVHGASAARASHVRTRRSTTRRGPITPTRRSSADDARLEPRLDHDGQHHELPAPARQDHRQEGRHRGAEPGRADRVRLRDQPAGPVPGISLAKQAEYINSATTSPTRNRA